MEFQGSSLVRLKRIKMKVSKEDKWFAIIMVFLISLLLWLCATGCTSSKNVQKSSYDSTATKDDSIRMLKAERDLFEQNYNELLYASVLFDTIVSHDTIHNTVYITKEGEVKAEGNIRKVAVNKSVFTSIIAEKDRLIDSLSKITQKVQVVTKTETKVKKVTVFPWWLLLVCAGIFITVKKLKFI